MILRRARAAVDVQVWKGAAGMVRTCLPKVTPEGSALFFGWDPAKEELDIDELGGDDDEGE